MRSEIRICATSEIFHVSSEAIGEETMVGTSCDTAYGRKRNYFKCKWFFSGTAYVPASFIHNHRILNYQHLLRSLLYSFLQRSTQLVLTLFSKKRLLDLIIFLHTLNLSTSFNYTLKTQLKDLFKLSWCLANCSGSKASEIKYILSLSVPTPGVVNTHQTDFQESRAMATH